MPGRHSEKLLMLPGLMCDARMFGPQIAHLPDAQAVDGYGTRDSLAAMARYVLDQAPQRFSLLGHSMGARVAMEVFRAAPERVARLALVSTGAHGTREGEAEKRHALRDLGRREGMLALVDAWLPPMIAASRRGEEGLVSPLRDMCVASGLETFEAQVAALLGRPEIETLLAKIRCPVLVAAGSEDVWSPPEQHAEIASQIPGARLVIIAGAGHMLPVEAPDALNAAIARWMSEPAQPQSQKV